jgi:hypothetical protein
MQVDHRKALEFAKAGDWSAAHDIVQAHDDKLSCLIHACVHRAEGDIENAKWWYGQAGAQPFTGSSQEEVEHLYAPFAQGEQSAAGS